MRAIRRPRNLFTPSEWGVSRVYWLVLLLLTAWVFLRGIAPETDAAPVAENPFLLVLVAAVANLSFRSWARVLRGQGRITQPLYARLGWVFVSADLMLVALGLRFSGEEHSPLWIVFFVIVVAETILATKDETRLIRRGAALALILGTLPRPSVLGLSGFSRLYFASLITSGYVLDMLTRIAFLTAVSSVTRRLRENAAATDRENATLRAEIALTDERARLAREIHDGVGNSLAAAVLRLEVAARTLEKRRASTTAEEPADDSAPLLREEARALREAMNAVRDWTFFTRPWPSAASASAEPDGNAPDAASAAPVVPASQVLASEADRLSRRTGLTIRVEEIDGLDTLPAPMRLAVLRITQEALTNAAKYARDATAACVAIRHDGATGDLTLTVSDDGCGFDVNAAGAGVGLSSMRERAQAMGGSLTVNSAPGKGTTVTAHLPGSAAARR